MVQVANAVKLVLNENLGPVNYKIETITTKQAIQNSVKDVIEDCSNPDSLVLDCSVHPLIAAANKAYDCHLPLVLSPDIIWLALIQGTALHINQNPEKHRKSFVAHEGKKTILVHRDSFVKGIPNPWENVFSEFSSKIKEDIGEENHAAFVQKFSTTGPVEMAAFEVTLMEGMKNYFDYRVSTACGIPYILLEGTTEDWQKIENQLNKIESYDLSWWINHVRPVIRQFIEASKGNVDIVFWNNILKIGGGSGGPYINGWINNFFPYFQNYRHEYQQNARNFIDTTKKVDIRMFCGMTSESYTGFMSKTPFKWEYLAATFDYEFVAGFVGVSCDEHTKELRPKIGWAVKEKNKK